MFEEKLFIKIPAELKETLRRTAFIKKMSQSEITRLALREYLE